MTHQIIMNGKGKNDGKLIISDVLFKCDIDKAEELKKLFNHLKNNFKPPLDSLARLEYKSPTEYFYHDFNGCWEVEKELKKD